MFLLDTKGAPRARATGHDWVEDLQYSRLLDADWDLGAIREARPATALNLRLWT